MGDYYIDSAVVQDCYTTKESDKDFIIVIPIPECSFPLSTLYSLVVISLTFSMPIP